MRRPLESRGRAGGRDYSQAWRSHRFWKRLPLIAFGICAAIMIVMGQFPFLQVLTPLLPLLGIVLLACLMLANIRLMTFVCPRCRKRFNSGPRGSGDFAFRKSLGKACGHCDLPLYDETG